jgi:hypothetical protein
MRKRLVSRVLVTAGLSLLLAAATPAFTQDEYRSGATDVRQHGYHHGFRDGYDYGRDVRSRGVALDYRTDAYQAADRGYRPELGSRDLFREGYKDGYRDGAEDGYNGVTTRLARLFAWRDRDFDPDRGGGDDRMLAEYRQPGSGFQDVAADVGYRDGVNAGLKDSGDHRSFRPHDHGAWKDADHGYDKSIGDKDSYRVAYRSAYESGYRAGFGGQ